MSDSESRSEIVMNLAEEFLDRYRNGERPPLREYVARHPELADEIRDVFPAMAMMENIVLADDSLHAEWREPEPPPEAPRQLGDYRIIREVGRGGMGIVYEAEQVSLGRHVALKVMPLKRLADSRQRRRFEREARAAAKLHHTNIVPVFGVGEHDGLPYYVMQFIQGLGLDNVLAELKQMRADPKSEGLIDAELAATRTGPNNRPPREDLSAANVARSLLGGQFHTTTADRTPDAGAAPAKVAATEAMTAEGSGESSSPSGSSVVLPGQSDSGSAKKLSYWQSVAQIGVQVADALEYAHKQGILHRDIKPSNLLLDLRGTVWVTDLGLAKATDQEDLTHTGDIVGTLRYMPPEAFEGRADPRGDVYALGLTLYEMLALRPAFDEKERNQLIKQVTTSEPMRLDRMGRTIPRDLVTIVHKAIERDPRRRYESAGELAADLRRFLDDEPIHARRTGAVERAWRWCRRNPMVAALSAAVAVLLVAGTAISWTLAVQASNRALDASNAAKDAEAKAEANRKLLSDQYVQNSLALMDKGDLPGAMLWIGAALKVDENDAERSAMHRLRMTLMLRECPRPDHQWLHPDVVTAAVASPDSRWIATACKDKIVRLFDAQSGKQVHEMKHPESISSIEFISGGKRLVTLGNLDASRPGVPVNFVATSTANLRVWDTASGKLLTPPFVHSASPGSPVLPLHSSQHAGDRLLITPASDELIVWDFEAGKQAGPPIKVKDVLQGAWLMADGRQVATLSGGTPPGQPLAGKTDLEWRLWDVSTGDSIQGPVRLAAFSQLYLGAMQQLSPDRRHLVISSFGASGDVRFLDLATGRDAWKLPFSGLSSIAPFNEDGSVVVLSTLSPQGRPTARIVQTATGKVLNEIPFEPSSPFQFGGDTLIPSPDARRLVRWAIGGTPRVWDAMRGIPLAPALNHEGVLNAEYSPDGRRLLTQDHEGTVRVVDSVTGHPVMPVLRRESGLYYAARHFTPDGRHVLTCREKTVNLWAVTPAGQNAYAVVKSLMAHQISLSPDGRHVIVLESNKASMLDIDTGKTEVLELDDGNRWAMFSPDSRWVAINKHASMGFGDFMGESDLILWETAGGRRVHKLKCPAQSQGVFSPDSRRLATVPSLRVFDVATGQALHEEKKRDASDAIPINGHGAFSGDGKRIMTYFPMMGGPNFKPMQQPAEGVQPKAFASVTVTDVETGKTIAGPMLQEVKTQGPAPGGLGGMGMNLPMIHADFSPDGRSVLVVGSDGNGSLWDVESGQRRGEPLRMPMPETSPQMVVGLPPFASFSPDGGKVLMCDNLARAQVVDARTGKIDYVLDNVQSAGFSPDGRRIATVDRDMRARIVSAAAGTPLTPTMAISRSGPGGGMAGMGGFGGMGGMLGGFGGMVGGFGGFGGMMGGFGMSGYGMSGFGAMGAGGVVPPMFSGDGRRLVTTAPSTHVTLGSTMSSEMRLFDADTGQPLGPSMTNFAPSFMPPFSGDGKRLLLVNRDQTFEVRDLSGDARPRDDLVKIAQAFSGRRIDETGSLVPLDAERLSAAIADLQTRRAEEFRRPAMPREAWRRLELDACMTPLPFVGFAGTQLPTGTSEFMIADISHPGAALVHLKALIAENPKDGTLWMHRGDALLSLAEWDDAVAAYTRAAESLPKNVPLYFRGQIHAMRGNYAQALEDLSSGGRKPFSPTIEAARAVLLCRLGRQEEFRAVCEQLLEHEIARRKDLQASYAPTRATRICSISPHLVKDRDGLLALADQTKPISLGDSAAVYVRLGRYEDAVKVLAPAVESMSGEPIHAIFLAMAEHHLGHHEEAARILAIGEKRISEQEEGRRALMPGQRVSLWQSALEEQIVLAEAKDLIAKKSP